MYYNYAKSLQFSDLQIYYHALCHFINFLVNICEKPNVHIHVSLKFKTHNVYIAQELKQASSWVSLEFV